MPRSGSGSSPNGEVTITKRSGRVVPLVGLVSLGIVGLVVTMVIPGFMRTSMPGDEASAIRLLRTINGAQKLYWERCHGYAGDLTALQTTGALVLREDQHGSLTKNGYRIVVKPSTSAFATSNAPSGECDGSVTEYVGRAEPVTLGTTGSRYFATDQHGAIYQSTSGPVIEPFDSATPVP